MEKISQKNATQRTTNIYRPNDTVSRLYRKIIQSLVEYKLSSSRNRTTTKFECLTLVYRSYLYNNTSQ